MKGFLLLAFTLLTQFSFAQNDTIRVMAYNLLNFPDPVPAGRQDTLANIVDHVKPDLLMVCELKSSSGASMILNQSLNTGSIFRWRQADYQSNSSSGANLQNLVFYDGDKLALYEQDIIRTHVRDINRYTFFFRDPFLGGHMDTTWLDVYVLHLKAGQSTSDENDRSRMADSLVAEMNRRGPGRNILIGGDFNVYSSTEAAYETITDPYQSNFIKDPIGVAGNWSGNFIYAEQHTQSTRISSIFGDGSGGGMDDRFDFILCSNNMLSGSGRLSYLSGTYKAWGNNGECYNSSIQTCEPNPVPAAVRNSLFYMSDHLPVVMDLAVTYPIFNSISEPDPTLINWTRSGDYLILDFPENQFEQWVIYSLQGQLLEQGILSPNQNRIEIKMSQLPSSMYFFQALGDQKQQAVQIFWED
jgi:endonuclease/exonuclease/phosphatase family metal-dependent hydrolase